MISKYIKNFMPNKLLTINIKNKKNIYKYKYKFMP